MVIRTLSIGLLIWFSFCSAAIPPEKPPGIVLRLRPSALNFLGDFVAKTYLADYIRSSLSEMNSKKLCKVNRCSLQDFVLNNFVPPKANVAFRRGLGIVWKSEKASFDIGFTYELERSFGIGSSYARGDACVQVSELSLTAELALYRRSDGRLRISLTKCSVDHSVLGIDIIQLPKDHDDDPDFKELSYDEILFYFHDGVNETLGTALCSLAGLAARAIPEGANWLNNELGSMLGFYLDDTLMRELIVETDYIEAAFSGEFRIVGDEVGPSFRPPTLDLPPPDSSMFALYLSDYFSNTLLDVMFRKGWLSVTISRDFLPLQYTKYRYLFDTTCDDTVCFGTMYPRIAEKYPHSFVKFVIGSTSRPTVNYMIGYQRSHAEFSIEIVITTEDGSEVQVGKLSVSISMLKTVSVTTDRVKGEVSIPSITVKDDGSSEEFTKYVPRFRFHLNMMADMILIPLSNFLGEIGIPLQLPLGLRLVKTNMSFIGGAFLVSTDVTFDPTQHTTDDYYLYDLYSFLFGQMRVVLHG